jgi:hypothetical protein
MVCITIVFLAVLVLFFGAQYVSRHGGFLGSDGSSTPRVAESIIESHKEAGHTALPLRRHEKGDSPYLKRKQAHAHTRRGEELRAFDEL